MPLVFLCGYDSMPPSHPIPPDPYFLLESKSPYRCLYIYEYEYLVAVLEMYLECYSVFLVVAKMSETFNHSVEPP